MRRNFNALPKSLSLRKMALVLGSVSLSLTACAKSTSDIRDGLSPVERIDFEFGGNILETNGELRGGSCLWGSPYDPISGSETPPAEPRFSTREDGTLITELVPTQVFYPDAEPIKLIGFEDRSNQLQPADEISRIILDGYGCL